MVPPDSNRVSRARSYLGIPPRKTSLRIRAYHPLWGGFPTSSASYAFIKPVPDRNRAGGSRYPDCATLAGYHTQPVWARPRSLAATRGFDFSFRSCGYLDVSILRVSFPHCYARDAGLLNSRRVAPFGHPRIIACLAASRGLSQLATSFVGSWHLGIHRVP